MTKPPKPPKKNPAKRSKSAACARTGSSKVEIKPADAKLSRAERSALNRAAHAAKVEAEKRERMAAAAAAAMPPAETIISVESIELLKGAGAEPGREQGPDTGSEQNNEPAPENDAALLVPLNNPYQTGYARIAKALAVRGATQSDIAYALGISVSTLRQYMARYDDFCEAIRAGDEAATAAVEHSLYQRAVGYTFEAVKVVNTPDGPVRVKYLEHLPPDVSAASKWLHNRSNGRWRPDSQTAKVELTGANGTPLMPEDQQVDPARQRLELARKVGFMLAAALHQVKTGGKNTDAGGVTIDSTAKDVTPDTADPTFDDMKRAAVDRLRAKFDKATAREPSDAK